MNAKQLVEEMENMPGPRFISVTYQAKNTGEIARYLLGVHVNYVRVCERDITSLEILLRNAQPGIETVVIGGMIDSLKESILAREQNREHVLYTKPGLYRPICQGVKIALNDLSLELCGFEHKRVVIQPGEYKKVKHRTEETALKAQIRRTLKIGKFRTLCIDAGHIQSCRLNGTTIVFE